MIYQYKQKFKVTTIENAQQQQLQKGEKEWKKQRSPLIDLLFWRLIFL